jgi:prophage DNA circulation protein
MSAAYATALMSQLKAYRESDHPVNGGEELFDAVMRTIRQTGNVISYNTLALCADVLDLATVTDKTYAVRHAAEQLRKTSLVAKE